MSLYRNELPQLDNRIFLSDGGMETCLIFDNGLDLPHFASFDLLKDEQGTTALRDYYSNYADIAVAEGTGFILETATWRASSDWAEKFGYDRAQLEELNRRAVSLVEEIRNSYSGQAIPMVISGNLGPRGDGYRADVQMSIDQARKYHEEQIRVFSDTNTDLITAITLTYPEEAIGVALAAADQDMPVVIGFTTELDGRLPNGQSLKEAIEQVDAATDCGPAYYMVNCAHVDHFSNVLADEEDWTQRIRGIRANASRCSHAELDESETLDDGDPVEFGQLYRKLHDRFPHLTVLGGCCGTDHRHVQEVISAIG
jgi:S-methylmethionine-dependent homocysteine/selenocysteine methylase